REHADAQRLGGIEYFSGEEITARGARADGAHDVGADRGRREAELRFGEAELRLRRADRDIARRDEPGAAGERRSVYARDRRLVESIERGEHLSERPRIPQVLVVAVPRHTLHPVEVGAGTEGRAVACEDHDLDGGVAVEF